jgi:8-oxo-dGTP diphosphatase
LPFGRAAVDLVWRSAYRIAYRLLRLWWWIRRPGHDGAVIALWLDSQILLVRQSYRRTLVFPGGGIQRGESARQAACRELFEELGLSVAGDDLILAAETTVTWEDRQDHVHIFELRLRQRPSFAIDRREIVGADFFHLSDVPSASVPPYIRAYLASAISAG